MRSVVKKFLEIEGLVRLKDSVQVKVYIYLAPLKQVHVSTGALYLLW